MVNLPWEKFSFMLALIGSWCTTCGNGDTGIWGRESGHSIYFQTWKEALQAASPPDHDYPSFKIINPGVSILWVSVLHNIVVFIFSFFISDQRELGVHSILDQIFFGLFCFSYNSVDLPYLSPGILVLKRLTCHIVCWSLPITPLVLDIAACHVIWSPNSLELFYCLLLIAL